MAAPWKIDGFEHGDLAGGPDGIYDHITGSATIVTSPVRSGARSAKIAAASGQSRFAYTLPASTRTVTQSFALHFTTADGFPAANCQLAEFINANGTGQLRWHQATGKLAIAISNIGNTDVGPALALDTWYWIDLWFDCSTGTTSIKCRVNGGTQVTVNRSQTAIDCTEVDLGTQSNTETVTVYYDDWLIEPITPTDYPLLMHHIESLIPSGDGSHNITTSGDFDSFTGTAFSNGTTNGYTFIGHRPLQLADTADQVIRQDLGTTSEYMEFTLENLASGSGVVEAVRVYASHVESGSSGASLGEARLLLSTNTEVLTEGSLSAIDSTEDPGTAVTLRSRMAIAPSGGWDRTKVDGLKARIGFADNAPDVNFIDFMVEVALFDIVYALPATVAGQATVPTPAIGRGAGPVPDVIVGAAALPSAVPTADANPAPSVLGRPTTVSTPGIQAGGSVTPTPGVVIARAHLTQPHVTTGAPDPHNYGGGYGEGYEEIEAEVVTPPPPPILNSRPLLRVRADWLHDIDPGTGAMPEPKWTDISALLRTPQAESSNRGRQHPLDRNEAGSFALTFGDPDRLLDPENLDGPYFPGISPDRRLEIHAVSPDLSTAFTMCQSYVGDTDIIGGGDTSRFIPIISGIIDDIFYDYPQGRDSVVVIRGTDISSLMSRDTVYLATATGTIEDFLNEILNARAYTGRAEGATGATGSEDRDIIAESVDVGVGPYEQLLVTEPMLEALQTVAVTRGGNFFIGSDGRPAYRPSDWLKRAPDPRLRFAVDGEHFRAVAFAYDNTLVRTDVTVTNLDGSQAARATDPAAAQRHPGREPLTLQTLLSSVGELQHRADVLLVNYSEPRKFVQRLDISCIDTDWPLVLSVDLWDKITLEVPLPNGDTIIQESMVEGIQVVTGHKTDWTVTWWLSVPPFDNLLSVDDSGFEAATIGAWAPGTNCAALESVTTRSTPHRNHFRAITGVDQVSVNAPQGAYVLWADAIAAGSFSVLSPVTAIEPRRNYLARLKASPTYYASDDITTPSDNTGRLAGLEFDWSDANGVFLSTDIGPLITFRAGQFQDVSTPAIRAPNGAAFLQIRFRSIGAGRTGAYIDDVGLTQVA